MCNGGIKYVRSIRSLNRI